ncbi:MAG: hypothetical protein AAF614_20465 [Chloroflexota bacterium]
MALENRLRELVFANEWLMTILRAVRACNLPDWYVGARAGVGSFAWVWGANGR